LCTGPDAIPVRQDGGVQTTLVDLEPGDPRLVTELFPVLAELRTHLDEATFTAVYAEGHPQGLRFTGAYRDGRCVGVAGWRIVATTHVRRRLYVDDLVTAAGERSGGVGHALLAGLAERARAAGCTVLDLDSGVQRHDAHRFYLRERMEIRAYHFTLPLAQG
jgi:GNAT superfamily N-acetyltransferase